MLRTNLSTRPFYNERLVLLLLGLVASVVLAITAFNVAQVITLTSERAALSAEAERNETQARQLRTKAEDLRRGLDSDELKGVAAAASEANALIDRRTFSWTSLFGCLETTLPPGVRLHTVRPEVDERGIWVSMTVVGRTIEDIDTFMEQLESSGAFEQVLSRQEEVTEDEMYRATLRGRYRGEPKEAPVPPEGSAGRPGGL